MRSAPQYLPGITLQLRSVVVISLKLYDLTVVCVDIILVLEAALQETDLVDSSAVLIIEFDVLYIVDLISSEISMCKCRCQCLVLSKVP